MKKTFTPDETMLQDYIQNKLNPQDTEQLELWLADHPEAISDLELDIMMKQAVLPQEVEQTVTKPWWHLFTIPQLLPLHAVAYAITGLFVFNALNHSASINSAPATFIELEKVRGAEVDAVKIEVNPNHNLVLRFFPDSMSDHYQVVIQSQQSDDKFEFTDLVADNLGSITVSINNAGQLVGQWQVNIIDGNLKKEQHYLISIE